ncbi:hypothetical protein [Modestobacter versicolor]|uniref:Uncharacterized protein n=1 Tax=Modestobacter versicolor TaxID=429133 RepID=A0A839Y2A0_9ACTN|nr:hypothetical protein [Modestobacter versicolor]MBB3674721.1 hypothetical protein [Modestobacter versicolor]
MPQAAATAPPVAEVMAELDSPTPEDCTSPFAPVWIGEMVRRQPQG